MTALRVSAGGRGDADSRIDEPAAAPVAARAVQLVLSRESRSAAAVRAMLKREDLVAGYARRLAARRGGACLGDARQRAAHMAGMSIARPGTP